jgi:integrase
MSAKIKFYLKDSKAQKQTLLLCRVYNNPNNVFKKSTGIKIHPKEWNTAKQEVKKIHSNCEALNQLVQQIRIDYENLDFTTQAQGIQLTKDYLNTNSKFAKGTANKTGFFDVFDKYFKSKKNQITESTQERYTGLKKLLQDFEVSAKYPLNFQVINHTFYEKFLDYLLNVRNGNNAYFSRVLRSVKSFFTYAFENGLMTSIEYKKFKPLKDNTDEIISLDIAELKKIEDLNNLDSELNNARNLFLLLCYTGIRYNDLNQINNNQIKNDLLCIVTQKTKETVYIPLHTKLRLLLNQYATNNIIKIEVVPNAKLNVFLKEIGKLAELNNDIKKVRYKGAERVEIIKKKWELLTTHTGKRTFITLGIILNIPIDVIKKITGNKNDAIFRKYAKFSSAQVKKEMEKWNN